MFVVKIMGLFVLTGDSQRRHIRNEPLWSWARSGEGTNLVCGNLYAMYFKWENGANRYVDFFFQICGMVCWFEPCQAMLNPAFKATQ